MCFVTFLCCFVLYNARAGIIFFIESFTWQLEMSFMFGLPCQFYIST